MSLIMHGFARNWRLVMCFSVGLVIAGMALRPAVAEESASSQVIQDPTSTGTPDTTQPRETESSAAEGKPAAAPEAKDWMDRIDEKFGEYLVKPLAAVMFFDFFTGDVKDAAGNVTRKGWLGTSIPFVVVWLFCGATFFTFRMGFINVRGFWHAIRLTKGDYDNPGETGEVSHFQALASALSATVGLGNIAGVAIAIGTGGPGATFWIIVVGLLGMSSKFAECTLGQMYRRVDPDGVVSGGPMRYLQDGLSDMGLTRLGTFLSILFALICVGASFGGGCAFQVGQSLNAIKEDLVFLDTYPWVYGLIMAFMAGIVIIGGIRSIGAVAGKIVPVMCGAYVLAVIYILATHFNDIGPAFGKIFSEAFSPNAMYGGFLGVLVIGIKRAVFSNEAGVGSAAIAHSAARTEEPVSEGIVALLEPFIDTVVVCTMTALVIIITGVYDNPELKHLVDADKGAALTRHAFTIGGHDWFRWILYAAVVLFAYSTLISWSYYGERCFTRLFGPRSSMVYKVIFLVFVLLGSIVTEGNILSFSDLLILGMSFPNILGVILLSGKVRRALDAYWEKYKSGKLDPTPPDDVAD